MPVDPQKEFEQRVDALPGQAKHASRQGELQQSHEQVEGHSNDSASPIKAHPATSRSQRGDGVVKPLNTNPTVNPVVNEELDKRANEASPQLANAPKPGGGRAKKQEPRTVATPAPRLPGA